MTLRQLREAAGLTQEQVAEAAKMRQGAVSNLESGRTANPTIDTIEAYAQGVGQPIDVVVAALRHTVAEAAA